jgi:hypothetical protein
MVACSASLNFGLQKLKFGIFKLDQFALSLHCSEIISPMIGVTADKHR